MGMAMQILTGFVTAPSTTLTAWTMASGDSLTVRNAALNSQVYLLNVWTDQQTAGNLEITSPKLHDNAHGIRLYSISSEVQPLLPMGVKQILIPQDPLTVKQSGSATGGDIESGSLLVWYSDLPGQQARLFRWTEIMNRIVNIFTVENTLALGTAGGYSGEVAINATYDFGKANVDYALIGYQVSAECTSVGWRAADTGNVRVGGPGNDVFKKMTGEWFKSLSEYYDLPTIPVFNWANKQGILVDGVQDENGVDVIITSIFAELR